MPTIKNPLARRRTQAERSEETRTRILDAAVSELRRKGYAGFRINEVAIGANVSKGAQTHHFPTKESLVVAALLRIYQASHAQSMKLLDALKPGDDVFEALLKDSEKFYSAANFGISVTLLGVGNDDAELRKQVRLISRKHRIPVEQAWLAALLDWGLPDEAARTVLYLTQSVYRGMIMRGFMRADPEYMRFSVAQWIDIARGYIATHRIPVKTPV